MEPCQREPPVNRRMREVNDQGRAVDGASAVQPIPHGWVPIH